jgi:predicted RNA binding protein YcfA (HicA-like mRNA interferase family)
LPREAEDTIYDILALVSSADVIRALKRDGWSVVRVKGSHHHFKHPTKPGIVTVPHPKKDIPRGTLASIERQSGIRLR